MGFFMLKNNKGTILLSVIIPYFLIVFNDIQGTADDLKNHVAVSIPPSPQRMNSSGSTISQNYGQPKLLFAIKKVSS